MQKSVVPSVAILAIALAFTVLCRSSEANDETNSNPGLTLGESAPTNTPRLSLVPYESGNGTVTSNPAVTAILQLPNGMVYEGEVVNSLPHGHGVLSDQYGTKQEGEWRYGNAYKITGKTVYPDGTVEVGTWNVDGTKSGGTITWKSGQVYKGDWKLVEDSPEIPDGTGEMTWPDGRKYVGQFRNGKMDGVGKMTYPGGKVEDGLWKQDRFTGAAY